MGLLEKSESAVGKHATEGAVEQTGLLAKASAARKQPEGFHEWAEKNHLEHAGLFINRSKIYMLAYARGLDVQTIEKSGSTQDFWTGTLPFFSEWQSFTDKKVTNFYQLFSSELQERIQSLHFLRISDKINSPIFMTVRTKENSPALPEAAKVKFAIDAIINSPEKQDQDPMSFVPASRFGLQISQATLLLISVKNAMTTALQNIPAAFSEEITNTVFEQLFFSIKHAFGFPNACSRGKNGEIKVVLFSENKSPELLIQSHLAQVFTPILGHTAAESIRILPAGRCSKIKGIQDFLTRG